METGDKHDPQQPVAAAAEESPAALGGEEIPEPSLLEGVTQGQEQPLEPTPAGELGISSTAQSVSTGMYQTPDHPSVEPVGIEFIPDRSTRPRVPTAKGLEYQQDIRKRALRSAITKWRHRLDEAEDLLVDCEDAQILTTERDQLSTLFKEVQNAAGSMSEVTSVEDPIDQFEEESRQFRKRINGRINELKEEVRSMMSRRSKGSSKWSRTSSRSSKTLKLEAAAKAAELRVQLRYHEEEAEFSKFKLKKELEITTARLQAIAEADDDEESTDLKQLEPEEDADTRVERFIRALPAQVDLEGPLVNAPTYPAATSVEIQIMGPTGLVSTAGTQQTLGLATMQPTSTVVTAPVTTSVQAGNLVGPAAGVQAGLPVSVSVPNTGVAFVPQPAPAFSIGVTTSNRPQHDVGYGLNPGAPPFVPSYSMVQQPSGTTQSTHFSEPVYGTPMYSAPVTSVVPKFGPQDQRSMQQESNTVLDLAEYMLATRVQPPEPPIFSGDPLEYPGWKSAFEALVENKRIPGCDKIHYLKRYLSGEALQCVEGHFLFSTVESFIAAKRVLDERYGDSYIVEDAFRSKLAKWPKVPPMNNKALRQFSDFLRQCLSAIPAIPSLSVLNDVRENQKLQEKLPEWVIRRWARIVAQHRASHKGFPSFETVR